SSRSCHSRSRRSCLWSTPDSAQRAPRFRRRTHQARGRSSAFSQRFSISLSRWHAFADGSNRASPLGGGGEPRGSRCRCRGRRRFGANGGWLSTRGCTLSRRRARWPAPQPVGGAPWTVLTWRAMTAYTDVLVFRRVLREARPCWPFIGGLFLLSLLASPLALLAPLPLKIAVDSVIGARPLPGVVAPFVPDGIAHSPDLLLALVV